MTGRELLLWGINLLKLNKKGENIAFLTLHYIDTKADIYLNNREVSKQKEKVYKDALELYVKEDLPIARYFGYTFFRNMKLYIGKETFIPRFETEQLVDELIGSLREWNFTPNRIIDLCTGSGCIALSLSKEFPEAESIGVDISENAIDSAKKSAKENNLNLDFLATNVKEFQFKNRYDLITMNPPYIKDKKHVEKSVLENEPKVALFSKNEGLEYYIFLAHKLKDIVNKIFVLAMEIGFDQAKEVEDIFTSSNSNLRVETIKDYQGLDRILIIRNF